MGLTAAEHWTRLDDGELLLELMHTADKLETYGIKWSNKLRAVCLCSGCEIGVGVGLPSKDFVVRMGDGRAEKYTVDMDLFKFNLKRLVEQNPLTEFL